MSAVTSLSGVLLLFSLCSGLRAQDYSEGDSCNFDFGYTSENGPDTWVEQCPACGGEEQSPINIDTSTVKVVDLPPLVGSFTENNEVPYKFMLRNEGYTVTLILEPPQPLTLQGGPLDGTFTVSEVQFCWGANDSVGSEHTFNGERFPLEAQWVLHKQVEDGEPNRELRIAQLHRLSHVPNPALILVPALLNGVINPGSVLSPILPINYDSIFSGFPADDYYAYNGSLTTPPCTEEVLWLVYPPSDEFHGITEDVLEALRELRSENGPIVNNFRPLQDLNGRLVLASSRSSQFQGNGGSRKRSGAHSRGRGHSKAGRRGAARRHH